jgi:hypothetical protein
MVQEKYFSPPASPEHDFFALVLELREAFDAYSLLMAKGTHTHTITHTHVYTRIHTYTHIHTPTYAHRNTHTRIHTHTSTEREREAKREDKTRRDTRQRERGQDERAEALQPLLCARALPH